MTTPNREIATFGGGCFWCVEAVFQQLAGVDSVVSGYAGGSDPAPTYRAVCDGTTGHAEVIQVTYDPERITFSDLLEVFFAVHDPTTRNRQGNDVGTQYRSIILWHDEQQRVTAEEVIERVNGSGEYSAPLVTEVVQLETFFPAEGYHQNYYQANPTQPYCSVVIPPKLAKLRARFAERLANGPS